jgi:hypothetical protein
MKTLLLILFITLCSTLHAQKLKDILYSGKLKTDTGTVIKKGDSLRLKENPPPPTADSVKKIIADDTDPKDSTVSGAEAVPDAAPPPPANPAAAATADNNKIWKQFVDEYTAIIKTDVMTSKKIKPGVYSVLLEYEIGIDGNITTNNVSSSPQSAYLVEEIKRRMMINTPQMTPVLMSNGKPRKVLKKQMLTFSKEKD